MKFDLENSPWTVVLVLGLLSLVICMVVGLAVPKATAAALGFAGVWVGLIGTALAVAASRAKKNGNGPDSS